MVKQFTFLMNQIQCRIPSLMVSKSSNLRMVRLKNITLTVRRKLCLYRLIFSFPDGTLKYILNDGDEETFLPDGTLHKLSKKGIVTIDHFNGERVI
jgi:hypothetical protein